MLVSIIIITGKHIAQFPALQEAQCTLQKQIHRTDKLKQMSSKKLCRDISTDIVKTRKKTPLTIRLKINTQNNKNIYTDTLTMTCKRYVCRMTNGMKNTKPVVAPSLLSLFEKFQARLQILLSTPQLRS